MARRDVCISGAVPGDLGQRQTGRRGSRGGRGASVTGLEREAALHIRSRRLPLYYWIEVGRDTALADKHPGWMASLQGHTEWRRFFPKLATTGQGEMVKNYQWTPVMYREAFEAPSAA